MGGGNNSGNNNATAESRVPSLRSDGSDNSEATATHTNPSSQKVEEENARERAVESCINAEGHAPSEEELVTHMYRVGKGLGLLDKGWRIREENLPLQSQQRQYEDALAHDPSCPFTWCNLGLQGGGEIHDRKYSARECYQLALERDELYAKAQYTCVTYPSPHVLP